MMASRAGRCAASLVGLLALAALVGCPPPQGKPEEGNAAKEPTTQAGAEKPKAGPVPTVLSNIPVGKWTTFFDGKTMQGWRSVEKEAFDMHGKVEVKDGAIVMGVGMDFTGIVWTGEFPKENYEFEYEAMRQSGFDIFGGVTFPVGTAHITMVMGGWGDTVVGLSSINDMNASENETTKVMSFDNKKWYRMRVRVTEAKIEAWIDGKQVIDLERKGRRFSIYPELELCRPFGLFTWQTQGAVRGFRIQRLAAPPKKPAKALPPLPKGEWASLFDGESLGGWGIVEEGEFALHGRIVVTEQRIEIGEGDPMSGIAWNRDFPRMDYEVALDAMRVEGSDFFCGLTFPVAKSYCTLIVGGWGGSVVGLSNVDGLHAAENKTTRSMTFNSNEWYRIRLRVTKARVEAWIDRDKVIEQPVEGHEFTIWPQQQPMKPLGIATYYTEAALRHLQYRTL